MDFKEYLVKKNLRIGSNIDSAGIKKLLIGKKAKILNQNGSHDYGTSGTTFIIGPHLSIGSDSIGNAKPNGSGNSLLHTNFELLDTTGTISSIDERKKELEVIIKDSQAEIEVLDMKKAHMQENGIEQLSEQEWKIYEMLLTLRTTTRNDMQKAKAIGELLIPA